MIHEFNDFSPTRIECGSWFDIAKASSLKGNILLVTSNSVARNHSPYELLKRIDSVNKVFVNRVGSHPDLSDIRVSIQTLTKEGIDKIVAIGGGSVIDTGKALSICLSKDFPGTLEDYLGTGCVKDLDLVPIELVAIPTTAGTGAEVTPYATIWDRSECIKYSLSSDLCYPSSAILDHSLLQSVPRGVKIATALDATSHALESVWNINANNKTLVIASQAFCLLLDCLRQLASGTENDHTLQTLQLASNYAGLAISKTRTALAHSISYPITLQFGISHGIACSFTLPSLLAFNSTKDDGRLKDLAFRSGLESVQALRDTLTNTLMKLQISKYCKEVLPSSKKAILDLAPLMLSKGRADNNLRAADIDDVRHIVRESLPILDINS